MIARQVLPSIGRLVRAARGWFVALLLAAAASASLAAPNQFVIMSDIHPARGAEPQLALLLDQLLELRPAFVVTLGDMCGDPPPDAGPDELNHAMQLFHRLREAEIEIYPTIGNHDGSPKINYICKHTPAMNIEFDPAVNPIVAERWCGHHRFWYSFNRGGIHFVIIDSNLMSPKPDTEGGESRWEEMQSFMVRDLCQHQNNPNKFPTLVFLHHPEYITGDRGCTRRPLHRALAQGLEQELGHTVAAAFAGHWHYYQYFPPEDQLGVQVYATPPSVHSQTHNPEYIVATVEADRITFRTVDTATGGPGKTGAVYYPISGKFTSLEDRSAGPIAK